MQCLDAPGIFPKAEEFFQEWSKEEKEPAKPWYECLKVGGVSGQDSWKNIPVASLQFEGMQKIEDWHTGWQAVHDGKNLYFKIECRVPFSAPALPPSSDFADSDYLRIFIEPRRFYPTRDFYIGSFGTEYFDSKEVLLDQRWTIKVMRHTSGWSAMVVIPFECLSVSAPEMLRVNIERTVPGLGKMAWIPRPPRKYRLIFGDIAPSDLGNVEMR